MLKLKKVISGGQTGADRAALDTAIRYGLDCGGFVPKGRRAEDGVIGAEYPMTELSTVDYVVRTEKNVKEGDGTVIISHGKLSGGSLLTLKKARHHEKPVLHLDLLACDGESAVAMLAGFLAEYRIEVLNVAGPRASGDPDIYRATADILSSVFGQFLK